MNPIFTLLPPIWRPVTHTEFIQSGYSRPGNGSWMIMLNCGHEVRRKSSQDIPRKVRCRECESIRARESQSTDKPLVDQTEGWISVMRNKGSDI